MYQLLPWCRNIRNQVTVCKLLVLDRNTWKKINVYDQMIIVTGNYISVYELLCVKKGLLLLFTPLEFFTSVLADGFSLEFEWQQVSSSHQDSSQYPGRPRQCCRWDSLPLPLPISKSSRPFINPLVIVPNAPITIGTIFTFMFHSFLFLYYYYYHYYYYYYYINPCEFSTPALAEGFLLGFEE